MPNATTHLARRQPGRRLRLAVALFAGFLLAASPSPAQQPAVTESLPAAFDAESREKIGRYYEALSNNPLSEPLLDRLVAEWSARESVTSLSGWLMNLALSNTGMAEDALLYGRFQERFGSNDAAIGAFERAWLRDAQAITAATPEKPAPANPGRSGPGLARALMRQHQFDRALEILGTAESRGLAPQQVVEVLRSKALCLQRLGRGEEVLAVWQSALAAAPDDGDLWEDAIETLWREGMTGEAIATLRELIETKQAAAPHDTARRRMWLAQWLADENKPRAALEQLEQVLDQAGNATWMERSVIEAIELRFRGEDNLTGLAERLRQLVEQRPGRHGLRFRLGEVLVEIGEVDAGFAEIREVLRRSPGERPLRERFARLLERSRRWPNAVDQWRRLIELHPNDGALWLELARAEKGKGSAEGAIDAVRHWLAAEESPDAARLAQAAEKMIEFGDPTAAETLMRQAMERAADELTPRLRLAAFLHRQPNRQNEALALLRAAPTSGDLGALLRVVQAMESHEHAAEAFELLLEQEGAFGREPAFLEAAARNAGNRKDYAAAFEFSLRRLRAIGSDSSANLSAAIDHAASFAQVMGQAHWPYPEIGPAPEFPDRSSLSVAERCLASELAARAKLPDTAMHWLGDSDELKSHTALTLQAVRNAKRISDWQAVRIYLLALIEGGEKLQVVHLRDLVAALLKSGLESKALDWVRRWKLQTPDSIAAWREEANILVALGDVAAALDVLRAALRRFDDSRELLVRFAQLSEQMQHFADAETALWKLYQSEESDGLPWVRSLHALTRQRYRASEGASSERLRERFEQRRRQNPRSLRPLLALCEIARLDGDFEREGDYLTAMLRIDPTDQRVGFRLARLNADIGEWQEAIRRLDEIEATSRQDTSRIAQQVIAVLMHYLQHDAAAERIAEACRKGDIDEATTVQWIDRLADDTAFEAAAMVESVRLEIHGESLAAIYRLGIWQEEARDLPSAAENFRNAMALAREKGFVPATTIVSMEADEAQSPLHQAWPAAYAYRSGAHRGRLYRIASFPTGSAPWLDGLDKPAEVWRRSFWHLAEVSRARGGEALRAESARLRHLGTAEEVLAVFSTPKPPDPVTVMPQPYRQGGRSTIHLGRVRPAGSTGAFWTVQLQTLPSLIPSSMPPLPLLNPPRQQSLLAQGRYRQAALAVAPFALREVSHGLNRPPDPPQKLRLAAAESVPLNEESDRTKYLAALREACAVLMESWPAPRRLAHEALLMTAFDNGDGDASTEATERFAKLLEDDPLNDTLRLNRIAGLLRRPVTTDAGELRGLVDEILALAPASVTLAQARAWLFDDTSWIQVHRSADVALFLLRTGDEAWWQQLDPPVVAIWRRLVQSHSRVDGGLNGATLEPLFQPETRGETRDEKQELAVQSWRKQRAELHRRFSSALLDREPYRHLALIALCRQHEVEGRPPPADAWQQALEIFSQPESLAEAEPDLVELFGSDQVEFRKRQTRKDPSAPRTGADFLLWLARETDHRDALIDAMIPALQKSGRESVAEATADMAGWYFAEGEAFDEALSAQVDRLVDGATEIKLLPERFRRLTRAFENGYEREQFGAVARALGVLLERWCQPPEDSGDGAKLRVPELGWVVGFTERMLENAVTRLDDDQVVTVMVPALQYLAGPAEERGGLLERARLSGDGSGELRRVELLFSALKAIGELETTTPLLYAHAWSVDQSLGEWPADQKVRPWRLAFDRIGAPETLSNGAVVRLLAKRPEFFGTPDQFDMVPMTFGDHHPAESMFERLVERMGVKESNYTYYHRWLEENAGDGFGARLMLALLTPPKAKVEAAAVAPLVGEIQRLPVGQQKMLAAYVDRRVALAIHTPKLLEWLAGFTSTDWERRFDAQKRVGLPSEGIEWQRGRDIAALMNDAARHLRFDHALAVWQWLREESQSFVAPVPVDSSQTEADHHPVRVTLSQLDNTVNRADGAGYEPGVTLVSLLIRDAPDIYFSPKLLQWNPPWKSGAQEAPENANGDSWRPVRESFERSIDSLARSASNRGVDDLVVGLVARDFYLHRFRETILRRAAEVRSTKPPSAPDWLWRRLGRLVSAKDPLQPLNAAELRELFDPEAPLAQRSVMLNVIGYAMKIHSLDKPRDPDRGHPRYGERRAVLLGEDGAAILETMADLLIEADPHLRITQIDKHPWLPMALGEPYLPDSEDSTPLLSEADRHALRHRLTEIADRYRKEHPDSILAINGARPSKRSMTARWDIAFAIYLWSWETGKAAAMWREIETHQSSLSRTASWPESALIHLTSPFFSRHGKEFDLPPRLDQLAPFLTARPREGGVAEVVRQVRDAIVVEDGIYKVPSFRWVSNPLGRTLYFLPLADRIAFLVTCMDEPWARHTFWPDGAQFSANYGAATAEQGAAILVDSLQAFCEGTANYEREADARRAKFMVAYYLFEWCQHSPAAESRALRAQLREWLDSSPHAAGMADELSWIRSRDASLDPVFWLPPLASDELPYDLRYQVWQSVRFSAKPNLRPGIHQRFTEVGMRIEIDSFAAIASLVSGNRGAPCVNNFAWRNLDSPEESLRRELTDFCDTWAEFRRHHPERRLNSNWCRPVVNAHLAIGDIATARRELDGVRVTRTGADDRLYAWLMVGDLDGIENFLEQHGHLLLYAPSYLADPKYDTAKWMVRAEQFANADIGLLLKTWLARVELDSSTAPDDDDGDASERLRRLAASFAAHPFTGQEIAAVTIDGFLTSDDALDELSAWLKSESAKQDLKNVADDPPQSTTGRPLYSLTVWTAHALQRLNEGDIIAATTLLDHAQRWNQPIASLGFSSSHPPFEDLRAPQHYERVWARISDHICQRPSGPHAPADASYLWPLVDKLIKNPPQLLDRPKSIASLDSRYHEPLSGTAAARDYFTSLAWQRTAGLWLALGAVTDHGEAIKQWLAERADGQGRDYQSALRTVSISHLLRALKPAQAGREQLPLDQRVAHLHKLFEFERGGYFKTFHLQAFGLIITTGWLSVDELLQVGPELAEGAPRHGFSWLELAVIAVKAERLDDARSHLDRAGSLDKIESRFGRSHTYRHLTGTLREALPDRFPIQTPP